MENLVKVELKDNIQVVDSHIVSKGLNIKHKNLIETIRKYQLQLEKLGIRRGRAARKVLLPQRTTMQLCSNVQ